VSQESLEQFMEKVGSNEELRASVENQLDSDGNISVDALIALGSCGAKSAILVMTCEITMVVG